MLINTMISRVTFLLILCLSFLFSLSLEAEEPEYKIKAGYLYYFGLYTKWPNQEAKLNQEFIVGILGEKNPFARYEDEIRRNKTIKNRRIKVIHFKRVEDIKTCDLLFINKDKRNLMQKINKICQQFSILTLSDYKGFSKDGGCVTFFSNKEDQIRFSIQSEVLEKRKLVIDAQLLNLAEKEPK
jgi:hypothetical protein